MADPARRSIPASPQHIPLVLVADDFADSRDLYAEYLADAGFRTATAEDGQDAIAQAHVLRRR